MEKDTGLSSRVIMGSSPIRGIGSNQSVRRFSGPMAT